MPEQDISQFVSPGGFVFGLSGWVWGEQRPVGITFFLNGTAMVTDQWGRPIKGATIDSKEHWFATTPPRHDDPNPGHIWHDKKKVALATHTEVIAALAHERIDWQSLTCAGWPQIPYEELKKMKVPPYWPFAANHDPAPTAGAFCTCVSCSIKDPSMRKDALRIKHESEKARTADIKAAEAEVG